MRVYLDHNASAPLRPEARAAMLDVLARAGNPSSAHREGARARMLVEAARAEVAALIGGSPAEVIFTSGATEANNLALRGVADDRRGIVTTAAEHASVLETARAIAADGVSLGVVGVDEEGRVTTSAVLRACTPETGIVSVGLANAEVGAVAPVAGITAALAGHDVIVHTDAAQAAGRIPIDVAALPVHLLSLSAHKLGGPTGVGALWVRGGVALRPQITGGPQERDRRAGTENVVGIVGFGVAARLARVELAAAAARMEVLRTRLWNGLRAGIADIVLNGPDSGPRLPNTLNVTVPRCEGESLLVLLDLEGVAASLGSACAAGAAEPSHVLRAMGRSENAARDGLRLSLGRGTSEAEVDRVVDLLPRLVAQVRAGAAA